MKKMPAIIGGIILLLLFGSLLAIPVSNDYAAMKTAKQAADIPLPEQAEYIESAYLRVNSQGMEMACSTLGQFMDAIPIDSGKNLCYGQCSQRQLIGNGGISF